MGLTPQDIVHYLCAAAGTAPLDTPGIYLVFEEENDLIEKFWTGSELADQVFIGCEVRENTPALYLLNDNDRCVFCVGADNLLRYYTYDVEAEEWDEVCLDPVEGNEEIIVHPSSRLSGSFARDGKIVFFEDQSGQLQSIRIQKDGMWESLPSIPVGFQQATPHTAIVADDGAFHMVYIHQDGHIHDLATGLEASELHDRALPGTAFVDDAITEFMVVPTGSSTFAICVLTSRGKLIWIDEQGARDNLGKVEEGRFLPQSSEENTRQLMKLMEGAVNSATGSTRKR